MKAVLRARKRAGVTEYLVNWVGPYPNSWEPTENVHHEYIELYEQGASAKECKKPSSVR